MPSWLNKPKSASNASAVSSAGEERATAGHAPAGTTFSPSTDHCSTCSESARAQGSARRARTAAWSNDDDERSEPNLDEADLLIVELVLPRLKCLFGRFYP